MHRPQTMDPHGLVLGDGLCHVGASPMTANLIYANKRELTGVSIMMLVKVTGYTVIRESIFNVSHVFIDSYSKFSGSAAYILKRTRAF